ncbi:MAG: M48 family metallopeptidase [Candidatus Omnitrophica bacterium]|nr:M48 family metallopeptidase [Candidatus Omnitrophota bacterium]
MPKKIQQNVNVDRTDPLKIFIKAVIGMIIVFVMAFVFLVALSETVIVFMPSRVNHSLGKVLDKAFQTPKTLEPERQKIQLLLDQLLLHSTLNDLDFRVDILETDQKNALAIPGGRIVITTALLKDFDFENELAFVLGHELGHYFHNDHLRGLSRSVIVMGLFGLLETTGSGGVSSIVGSSIGLFDLNYSRQQERAADAYGLELLWRHYGHVDGARQTFRHLYQEKEKSLTLNGFLSTHPITEQRVKYVEALIAEKGYGVSNDAGLIPYVFPTNPIQNHEEYPDAPKSSEPNAQKE